MKMYNNHDGSTGRISSSKGNQIKMCVNDVWYKADFLGYEGASEYLCSCLLPQTNISDYVKYELETININKTNYNGCSSKSFIDTRSEEIITANKLFKQYYGDTVENTLGKLLLKNKIEKYVELVERATGIKDYGKLLTTTVEWDRFVLNEDRHYNNLAFIRNINTEEMRNCPIFDNGAAYLSDTRDDYPLEKSTYGLIASVSSKPFHNNFDRQVEACEEIFGKQLVICNKVAIPEEVLQNINNMYGDKVSKRMSEIFSHQLSICENLEKSIKPKSTQIKLDEQIEYAFVRAKNQEKPLR